MADAVNSMEEVKAVADALYKRNGPAGLKAWLDRGGNPDARCEDGSSMLYRVILMDECVEQLEMVRMLLEAGASVELPLDTNERSTSPMHHAAMFHKYNLINLLLDYGADINKYSPNRMTPLYFAVDTCRNAGTTAWDRPPAPDNIDAVRLLVSRGAKTDSRWSNTTATEEELAAMRATAGAPPACHMCHTFLRDVRLAGGYRRYVNAPRKSLVVLRELCLRGRAAPPAALARLFVTAPAPRRRQTRASRRDDDRRVLGELPAPIFWHVLEYWRSDREPYVPPTERSIWPNEPLL